MDKTFYPTPQTTFDKQYFYKHYFIGSERISTKVTLYVSPASAPSAVGFIHGSTSDFILGMGNQVKHALDSVGYSGNISIDPVFNSIVNVIQQRTTTCYYHYNHQGSVALVTGLTGSIQQVLQYLPYGGTFVDHRTGSYSSTYTFSAKEKDAESGYNYFGARYYSDNIMQWLSVDPMSDKYPSMSPYMYCAGNPIKLVDPDGKEPILPFVGSVTLFKNLLNNSPRKVGYYKGQQAANYLASLGNTKFNWNQMRLVPTETGYFNKKEGRYIYTEKGGWLDMSHFMFYAGRAYQNKINGNKNPIGDAVQDGYIQERFDRIFAPHSAYSYEDLPSDKYGAEFGAKYFDPNSERTFGEQLENYLNNVLKATEPTEAPNYHKLSKDYPDKPSVENHTTKPYYINKINNEENN